MSDRTVKWVNQIPLQRKIMAACLVVILIPLTILVIIFLDKSIQEERKQTAARLVQANEVILDRLSTVVTHIKTTSAMYLVYPEVIGYVKNNFHMEQPDYILTLRKLRKNVMSAKINPYVSSITYLSAEKNAYSGAGYNGMYLNHLFRLIEEMEEHQIKSMVSPVYETVINQQSVKTITYGFALVDTYTFEKAGYAFINLDLKQLGQNFLVFTQEGSTHTLAVQGDHIVYQESRVTDSMAAQIIKLLKKKGNEGEESKGLIMDLDLEEGNYRCAVDYDEVLDLTIMSLASQGDFMTKILMGMLYYFVILVIMIAVFIGVSIALSVKMTAPIRVLEEGMHHVERGELIPITRELNREDDLGQLIHGFNLMVSKLKESILREYESEHLQKKAQIMMLESQINPHFLYNTLNVMNSIATLEDVPAISELSTSLGDMFRYNISGRSMVTVKEEITQIRRYAGIQNFCMREQIEVIYSVSEEAGGERILKFLLQPLVENCFEHGFSGTIRKGFIRVSGITNERGISLSVEDNGAGIGKERLAYLKDRCKRPGVACLEEEHADSIGLLNVNFRLKSYYGEGYGLKIESQEGQGTRIILQIPKKEHIGR